MTNASPRPTHRTLRPPRRARGLTAALALSIALSAGTAIATVPTSNDLGVRFEVLRSGPTAAIEIRLRPRRDFDAVSVEAGSGVATLAAPCGFTKGSVRAGQSYECRVNVTGPPSESAMTVNVVGRRAVVGGAVPVTEVHHVSVRNPAFALSLKNTAASHHEVAGPSPVRK